MYKKALSKIIESIRFHHRVATIRTFINPEIRDMLSVIIPKQRKKAEEKVKKETEKIEEIEKSYDFQVRQHFTRIRFENMSKRERLERKSSFAFLNKGELWYVDYDKSAVARILYMFPYRAPEFFRSSAWFKLLLLLVALFFIKIGFINGKKDSIILDEIHESITDIRNEDELFNIVISMNKPLIIMYYYPSDHTLIDMMMEMGRVAEKYGNESFILSKVNCRYNLDLCMKKAQYLKFPQWELMMPPVVEMNSMQQPVRKFPIIPCMFNRTLEGLEGFLMKENIIADKFNPLQLVNSGLNKRVYY